jgi:molybdopterin-guanine dinucleotide biosynthesis protein B
MPSIVSIIGKSKSGKTTLIERLIRELKSRGYRVATIKHTHQGVTFDDPDKDSHRYVQAGSEVTVISSPDKVVLIKPVEPTFSLDEIVHLIGEDCNIVLAEGFTQENTPKIEVHRKEVETPLSAVKKLIAIVTDEPLETKTRQFSLQDIKGLANLLEKGFIKPQQTRTSLYINGLPVSLTTFPREIISNILLALAASLKGVGEVNSLDIFLRIEPKQDL